MQVGDYACHLAVYLFRPGRIDVAAAQSRLDMAHRDAPEVTREARHHRRQRVAMHQHPVRLQVIERLAEARQDPAREAIERLAGLHQVKIKITDDPLGNQARTR